MAIQAEVRRTLRLPDEVNTWLKNQAKRNGASLNSEVVRCIRERMDRMTGPGGAHEKGDVGQSLAATDIAPQVQSTAGAANERA